ncbi:thiol reductant ABC exporter subunit CydC [Streptomyces sp. G-G2]|uniref:thiol reductant ABC exporter subunit CydC n=1 Tax=Streptomyces sp. G-G2 TaxID=3046201 RepID=UPI0024B99B1A|nr:thiol reductant ABC exporter subunit CydC [Streptomyces sp. G-G2]MDJ0384748.1 thiol reductant ABC exporter subunit CydC [Streptomyces sp. G-G2]
MSSPVASRRDSVRGRASSPTASSPVASSLTASSPVASSLTASALTRADLGRLVGAAVAAALGEACAIALTASAAWLICRASQQPPLGALMVAVVAVRAFALGRGALRYAERLWGHDATLRVMERVRGRLLTLLAPHAPYGLRAFSRGELLNRLVADVDAVQDALLRVALPLLTALLVGGGVTVWAALTLPTAGWALGAGLLLACVALPALAAVAGRRGAARLSAARAELAARTVDVVEGAEDLALCGASGWVREREHAASRAVARHERVRARAAGAFTAAAVLVQLLTTTAVAVLAVRGTGPVTAAVLTLTALATLDLATPVRTASEHLTRLTSSLGRLRDLHRLPSSPSSPSLPAPAQGPAAGAAAGPAGLEFTDVGVTHPGGGRPVLEGFGLVLAPGRKVALVGPSGSGKSTVAGLARGLLEPTAGRVALDGVPLADLPEGALRPRLAAGLTQYHHVFAGTVREHLLLARPGADEARLWAALARAGAADWVRTLPGGLDAEVAEDAAAFSGGERRRLGLAAALLADPAVLVLDEPTESLAPRDADAVLAAALDGRPDQAVLLISHRTIGLDAVDEVVVLDEGRVIQRGTHAELLAAPGHYRERHRAERAAEDAEAVRDARETARETRREQAAYDDFAGAPR